VRWKNQASGNKREISACSLGKTEVLPSRDPKIYSWKVAKGCTEEPVGHIDSLKLVNES
jgi:hypothetical protein